jgi:hypothetical protein
MVEDYEWRGQQCYPATEKTCLLSIDHVWYINNRNDAGDVGACYTIPDNEVDCAKTDFYDWYVSKQRLM